MSPEPVHALDIAELAAELVRPLAAQRGISLSIDKAAGAEVVVFADRQRLSQILINLLSNAVKYNRKNGSVTMGFRPMDGGRVRLTVTDTGAGIPAAKLSLLFQPFERLGAEQTATEGTGLGLALSRGLAEAMGGTLGVESVVDQGSTFWIELALTEAARTQPPARGEDAPLATRDTKGTVLYIEDNRSNVTLMKRVLGHGVRLFHAADARTGLSIAHAERPAIFLTCICRTWRATMLRSLAGRQLRGIPSSSSAPMPHQNRRGGSTCGAVGYLTKPLEIRQILTLIDERLNQGAGA